MAAGRCQNSQAGRLRHVAQPSRLRVCGASQPRFFSGRLYVCWKCQDAPHGYEQAVFIRENRAIRGKTFSLFPGCRYKELVPGAVLF